MLAPFASCLLATTALAQVPSTARISVSSAGVQANAACDFPRISADGRRIAFRSTATNLVAGDTNAAADVFVRDLVANTTVRASVGVGGSQSNGASGISGWIDISGDGRYVAFCSLASNLVANDTNANLPTVFGYDVFVRDLAAGTTQRVSVDSSGTQGDRDSMECAISDDGRYVAFTSGAQNWSPPATNATDVFVRDRTAGTTIRVSQTAGGAAANGRSISPAISADGQWIAFASEATNLVAGDTNAQYDVFLRSLASGVLTRVSTNSVGAQALGGGCGTPALTADGGRVAFYGFATNLVGGDTNSSGDVFVKHVVAGTTARASVAPGGLQANFESAEPGISADGRWISFWSGASNLVAPDANNYDVFVRDDADGSIELVDVSSTGVQANQDVAAHSMSGNGRFVAFASTASNLVGGDTNAVSDVFLRDRGAVWFDVVCAGDGTATACPCGNTGPSGAGCANSLGLGAVLQATGAASLAADMVVLSGSQMPNSTALYIQGSMAMSGGLGIAFGDGLRCAGGSVVRLGTKMNTSGASQYPGPGDPSVSVRGGVTLPGTRVYQVWYRNAASYCTTATFNLSNGLMATWSP